MEDLVKAIRHAKWTLSSSKKAKARRKKIDTFDKGLAQKGKNTIKRALAASQGMPTSTSTQAKEAATTTSVPKVLPKQSKEQSKLVMKRTRKAMDVPVIKKD